MIAKAPATTLLALDAATEACSAAVVTDDGVLAGRFEALRRGHAERLMPMVQAVMAEAALDYRALSGIVTTIGPGSFTGVRVGLAAARGIALAAGLPLVGVTTLEALAAAVPASERAGRRILAALDALRGQVYAQWFDEAGTAVSAPTATTAMQAASAMTGADTVLVGSGAGAILDALGPEQAHAVRSCAAAWPDAAVIGGLVASRARRVGGLGGLAAASVQPLYLREAGARPSVGVEAPTNATEAP